MNQFNILPSSAEARQSAVDSACEVSGLPTTKSLTVAVLRVGPRDDEQINFEPVETCERIRFVPCDVDDVDSDGDRISSYSDGIDGSFYDFASCETHCLDHDSGVPGRVSFWSEEDALIDACNSSCGPHLLGFVEVEVPYMILGTSEDYCEMVAGAARAAAIDEEMIDEDD